MRKTLLLGSVAAMAFGLTLTAAPAQALGGGDTLVSFTVGTVGGVSISPGLYVPGAAGTNTVNGTVASVVTDLRTGSNSWTDTVSTTDFTLVGATTPTGTALIPAASAKLWTPTALVSVPGTATITNDHATSGTALALSTTAATLLSAATTNVNVTALTHNLQIDTTGKASGLFTGTLTQTVS